jgi:succinyl-CoA---D-citramalate CoA-transferase
VLELGTLIAGPSCTRTLAEFGAEVIKVELPHEGDPIRRWRVMHARTSLWWYVQSRNKKCITLDSRTAEGLAILKKLIQRSDVLVENFRPGTLDKWGLDEAALKQLNPRLVLARVSGFGQDGPYSKRPGFGAVAEAMGGLRHVTGYPDRPPVRVGISLGDSVAALYATIGILMALYTRDVKGRDGQTVDVALYEAVFALMESMVTEYAHGGVIRERTGSILPGIVPSNLYPTKDGKYLLIAGNGDAIVRRLLTTIGRPELVADERFSTNDVRVLHMEFIDGIIADWTRTLTLDECLAELEENDVPAGRIYDAADILSDPHYQARDMLLHVDHVDLGSVVVPGIVPKLSATPGAVRWLGPAMGEHNAEVFAELGLDEGQLADLASKGVI